MLHGPSASSRGWGLVLAFGLLDPAAAFAQVWSSARPKERVDSPGAVVAPAVLPRDVSAAYAYLGFQEFGAGYRQGFQLLELEGRARFNNFLISSSLEGVAKYSMFRGERADLAPLLGIGITYNWGATYYDEKNFQYFGIRVIAGVVGSYNVGDQVALVAEAEAPLDFSLNASGGLRFKPMGGLGVEFKLSSDTTLLTMGDLGLDLVKGPSGAVSTSLGYQLRVGIGFRLF